MGDDVKTRRYDNRNRQVQARHTRRRMLDAARRLFVRDGYAATTIQALADEAAVAPQTVYAVFGSKLEVLNQLVGSSVGGDLRESRLVERPAWREWEAEQHVDRLLAGFARVNREICERVADVVGVVASAAASNPEIARMWEESEAARYTDQRRLADRLADLGALDETLTRDLAADVVWTLAGPGPYTDLVQRRGWGGTAYERWLVSQLRAALVDVRAVGD